MWSLTHSNTRSGRARCRRAPPRQAPKRRLAALEGGLGSEPRDDGPQLARDRLERVATAGRNASTGARRDVQARQSAGPRGGRGNTIASSATPRPSTPRPRTEVAAPSWTRSAGDTGSAAGDARVRSHERLAGPPWHDEHEIAALGLDHVEARRHRRLRSPGRRPGLAGGRRLARAADESASPRPRSMRSRRSIRRRSVTSRQRADDRDRSAVFARRAPRGPRPRPRLPSRRHSSSSYGTLALTRVDGRLRDLEPDLIDRDGR